MQARKSECQEASDASGTPKSSSNEAKLPANFAYFLDFASSMPFLESLSSEGIKSVVARPGAALQRLQGLGEEIKLSAIVQLEKKGNILSAEKRALYLQAEKDESSIISRAETATSFNATITFEAIISFYPGLTPESELYNLLNQSTEIINSVRSVAKYSSTHPDANILSMEERMMLLTICNIYSYIGRNQNACLAQKLIEEYFMVRLTRVANCDQCARIGWMESNVRWPQIRAEIFNFLNGKHTFLVLNRLLASDPTDYTTWGSYAVICDPWAGTAFAAPDIPKRLLAFSYNPYTFKNTVYHLDAKPILSLAIPRIPLPFFTRVVVDQYKLFSKIPLPPAIPIACFFTPPPKKQEKQKRKAEDTLETQKRAKAAKFNLQGRGED